MTPRPAGGLPAGDGGPHVFVADLERPVLDEDDRHHLARVLRLRDGDPFTASDGAGSWRPCRFGDPVEVAGPAVTVERPTPTLTVAFALVKGERPELVVQKLTELGVDRIVAFTAARSVVRWDAERTERQRVRLARVAREAAMQSRRCVLPEVEVETSFASVAGEPGAVLAHRGGRPLEPGDRTVLIGPEGGWTPEEVEGLPIIGLASTVLRAETAAIAAGALMNALRSNLS